jgi:hypothetical protein
MISPNHRVSLARVAGAAAAIAFFSSSATAAPAVDGARRTARRAGPDYMLIALSDSLGHGTMDGVNNELNTRNAFVQLIADKLQVANSLYFSQPFFDEQEKRMQPFRIPTNLSVDGSDSFSLEGLEYYRRAGVDTSFLSTDLLGDKLFPGRLKDKYDKVLYPLNLLNRGPVSQLDGAVWLLGTKAPALSIGEAAVLLWIGNNDSSSAALGYGGQNPEFQPIPLAEVGPELKPLLRLLLRFGERQGEVSFEPYGPEAIERHLTLVDDFAAQYERILSRLLAETAASGVPRRVLACTLPYYSSVGYLMDSEDLEYYLRKQNPAYNVPPSFKRVAPPGDPIEDPLLGDRVSLLTFGFMYALLNSGYSVDYVNGILETAGQQRDGLVLSESEQQSIRDRIDGYNDIIHAAAAAHAEVHVVEIGDHLNETLTGETEVIVGGRKFDRKWSRGSAFSIDGIHPGYTGQAYVANFLLDAIDTALGTDTTPYDLEQVSLLDPYIDRDGDGWVPGPDIAPTGIAKLLFLLTDGDDGNAAVGADLPDDTWELISDILLERILGIPSIAAEAARIRAGS